MADDPAIDMPDGFPLTPIDSSGRTLSVGDRVRILTVDSCAHNLPGEDKARLRSLEGETRKIIEFDRFEFVWLSFGAAGGGADFSLRPSEVSLV